MPLRIPVSDFLSAYLDLAWGADLDAGLVAWIETFQRALDGYCDDDCRRLLREIKAASLTPEVEEVVRYVEGRWLEQQGNLTDAVRAYQASLELSRVARHALREAQTLGDLALAYGELGRHGDAVKHLESALDIYRSVSDTEAIVEILGHLGAIHTDHGEWRKADQCFQEGLAIASTPQERAFLMANIGVWHQAQRQHDTAAQCFQDALNFYRTERDLSSCARVLNNLGVLAVDERRIQDARQYFVEALRLDQALGDWANAAQTLGNLALVAQAEAYQEEALQHITQALESTKTIGNARAEALFLNLRGLVLADLGNWEAAARDHRQAVKIATEIGDELTKVTALNNLGTAHRHREQLDAAQTYYEKALSLAELLDARQQLGEIAGNLGHLYAQREEGKQAKDYYHQALAIAEELGDHVLESASLLGLCSLAFDARDVDHLQPLLDRTWSLGELTHQPDVLARVSWIWGDIALVAGDRDVEFSTYAQAAVFAAQAGGILLNATLERIDIHLEYMQPREIRRACETLQQVWDEASLLEEHPELAQWLKERVSQ